MRAIRPLVLPSAALAAAIAPAPAAQTDDFGVFIQIYDISYAEVIERMPDIFAAGYEGVWWPPNGKASLGSIGYDPFDRFDLGSPGDPTLFGTEAGFRAAVEQFQRANVNFYLDAVLNHNGARSARDSAGAIEEGAWPGFFLPPDDVSLGFKPSGSASQNWFDFNNASGFGADAPGFNETINSDLVGLVDFRHTSNYQMIRHPTDDSVPEFDFTVDGEGDRGVDAGWPFDTMGNPLPDARRIPAGTVFNQPDPGNAALYTDRNLAPTIVVNPDTIDPVNGGIRNTGGTFTIYPFNTDDPAAGDPIMENATGVLLRWSQWMLDVYGIDGFRLDAAKHAPEFFWDTFWDAFVFNRRTNPDGTMGTPYTFGESTLGNFEVLRDYIRIDGFGFRDTLDLAGAGRIRTIIGGRGGDFAAALDDELLDANDESIMGTGPGTINASAGTKHIHSHDNGTFGDGGSPPNFPSLSTISGYGHAFMTFLPGPRIIYHNARQFHTTFTNRFWVREGNSLALGYGGITDDGGTNLRIVEDDRFVELVRLDRRYGRGDYIRRWEDLTGSGATSDVFIYERSNNVVVAVNDSYTNNEHHTRSITTNFAAGTRLHELTGNALPGDELLIVGASGSLTITVPSNQRDGVTDDFGYVVYGPATPSGTLTIVTDSPDQVIPADPPFVGTPTQTTPVFDRRVTPVTVVRDDTFTIRLETTKTDPDDPNWDDAAAFRFNRGYVDLNGNGFVDIGAGAGDVSGYEDFTETVQPIFGTANETGLYEQTITTADLPEGMNYLSAVAFRHRDAAEDILFGEWRESIYVDVLPPQLQISAPLATCGDTSAILVLENPDFTADELHVYVNLDPGITDPPVSAVTRATAIDFGRFQKDVSGLVSGTNEIAVLAIERFDGVEVSRRLARFDLTIGDGFGDADSNTVINTEDLYGTLAAINDFLSMGFGAYRCELDFNGDGLLTDDDLPGAINLIRADEPQNNLP
ncbi:MAG: hypothetical protein AAGI30_13515 [Planctomycetota bacterium]